MAKRGRERYQGGLAGDAKEFVPNQADNLIAAGNRWYNVSMASALAVIIGVLLGGVPTPVLVFGVVVAIIGLWQAKVQTKNGEELKQGRLGTAGDQC